MRILLFGKIGQLGWEFQRTLPVLGNLMAIDYPEIDLSHPDHVISIIREFQPDLIVNATAFTAVDLAETEEELAFAINAKSPALIAEEAANCNAVFVHFSTDYVFDGTKNTPYGETDSPNPLNVYGKSKLIGEQGIINTRSVYFIFRTSWVYRIPCRIAGNNNNSLSPDNFVTKVLRWSRHQKRLKLVNDQIANPTWARMLAEITTQVLTQAFCQKDPIGWSEERKGVYHLAGDGYTSRLDWGKSILQNDPHPDEQIVNEIIPVSTVEFPTPADRPLYSALNCDLFTTVFGLKLPAWGYSLKLALEEIW